MIALGSITDAADVYRLFEQKKIDLSTGLTVLTGLTWYELEIECARDFWGAFVLEVARRVGDRSRNFVCFDVDLRTSSSDYKDDFLIRLYRAEDSPSDEDTQYWYAHMFQQDWPKIYVGFMSESRTLLAYPNNRPLLTLTVDMAIENLRESGR